MNSKRCAKSTRRLIIGPTTVHPVGMSKSILLGRFIWVFLAGLPIACGGTTGIIGGGGTDGGTPDPSQGGGSGSQTGEGGTNPQKDGGAPIVGPKVTIRLQGSMAAFPHQDAFASQTPKSQSVSISSLRLYRDANDQAPLVVFDHGDNAIEVQLLSGKPTIVAEVSRRDLTAGHYHFARVGVRTVSYRIQARLHALGFPPADGEYESIQVMSDGTTVDGKKHDKGWFRTTFHTGGTKIGPNEGTGMAIPVMTESGGISLDTSGPETAYRFAADIPIDPTGPKDVDVLFEVNLDRNYRWIDQPNPGYSPNVFDTTPTGYEQVMRFGANSFTVAITEL